MKNGTHGNRPIDEMSAYRILKEIHGKAIKDENTKMTENERQEILKDIKDGYIDAWDNLVIDELFEQIEREHEEIQQYRELGTAEEILKVLNNQRTIIATQHETLRQYRAIGTIDEFKALKEKKKNFDVVCPLCGKNGQGVCKYCGHSLEI